MSARRTLVAALVALSAGGACGDGTSLRRVSFRVQAAGVERDASAPPVLHTPLGWEVTIATAQVSVGPLYFHNAAPMVGTSTEEGRVVAEVLAVVTVDVLNPAPRAVAGGGSGVTEPVHSAEVRFTEETSGPIADAAGAGAAVAHLAGVARRGDVEVPFDGTLALPMGMAGSAYQAFLAHRVVGIPADFTVAQGGTLTLRVNPARWFDFVAFDGLGPAGAGGAGVRDFSGPAAAAQLTPGVASSHNAFVFTWTPAP